MTRNRVHVDFNDLEEGEIIALTRHADEPAAVSNGSLVTLWDEEGNSAQGRVIEVGENDLVRIEVLRGTWRNRLAPAYSSPVPVVDDFMAVLATSYAPTFNRGAGHYYRITGLTDAAPTTVAPPTPLLPALPPSHNPVPSSL